MLHTPNYDVRTRAFCGPTAISAVTGEPISVIRDVIRSVGNYAERGTPGRRASPIKGVSTKDLLAAMEKLGWKVVDKMPGVDYRLPPAERMKPYRFASFLDEHGHDGPFIVNVTGHYYAVSHGEVCDTFTCLPKDIAKFKRGWKRWVKHWWKFARA
jgi:hypothetical protein